MSGRNPAVMMGSSTRLFPDKIRTWLFDGPSDHDLARAYAEVHNHIGCEMYEDDVPEAVREDWLLLKRQMLYQIAKRWLPTQGISWNAGWWIDDGKGKIYETIEFPKAKNGDLIVPYDTPIGGVCLWVDGDPTVFDAHWEPDYGEDASNHLVDANYRLAYHHVPDGKRHVVECRLDPLHDCELELVTGQRLVALEARDAESVVFMGVEWGNPRRAYDYRAEVSGPSVVVTIPAKAKEQWVVFGLAWVEDVTEENAVNPRLMGNPVGEREKLTDGSVG